MERQPLRDDSDHVEAAMIGSRCAIGIGAVAIEAMIWVSGGWYAGVLALCLVGLAGVGLYFDGYIRGSTLARREQGAIPNAPEPDAIGGRVRT